MSSLFIGKSELKYPVIQGGMGVGVSLSGLASAVATEGGVGIIASVGIGVSMEKDYSNLREYVIEALRQEIRKARSMTQGVLGVNIMVVLTDYERMVQLCIEEGIDIIFSGSGLPLDLPKYRNPESKTALVPIVSSARAANIICNKWEKNFDVVPDAIVVEGPLAGGHLGFHLDAIDRPESQLEVLIPQVVDIVKQYEERRNCRIPVIAAGGVFSGADIHRFLQLGASGVQMGTRFVGTYECDASDAFKQLFVKAEEKDIQIITSPVGLPGRAIISPFLEEVTRGIRKPIFCKYHCIHTCDYEDTPYCIADALLQGRNGNIHEGFAFSGANAYKIKEIVSVKEIFDHLKQEYREVAGQEL
ncbi:MAG: nitronate monooxygenase family protein [Bacteroidetes bacterium]|nr:nitronate monooxygenase family protein [Bacteroidota bacterium]MBU1719668.1 nitronate monooxygenase family protein [Bacteroidota bacterium]